MQEPANIAPPVVLEGPLQGAGDIEAAARGVDAGLVGVATGSRVQHVSRRLSDLLSPPVVALVTFWALARTYAAGDFWTIFLACALSQTLLPIAYLKWAVHRGWIGDVDMSRRAERRVGLPLLGIVYLGGCLLSIAAGAPAAVLTVCLCSLVVVIGIWVVNLFYKASGHVAGTSAYMTVLALFVAPHAGFLLIPVLAWARVRSGAHTAAQTIWGFAIGSTLTWLLYVIVYRGIVGA